MSDFTNVVIPTYFSSPIFGIFYILTFMHWIYIVMNDWKLDEESLR